MGCDPPDSGEKHNNSGDKQQPNPKQSSLPQLDARFGHRFGHEVAT
jgi:hypothetical protein